MVGIVGAAAVIARVETESRLGSIAVGVTLLAGAELLAWAGLLGGAG